MKKVVIGKVTSPVVGYLGRVCGLAGLSVVGRASYWDAAVEIAVKKDAEIVILGDYLPTKGDGARAAEQLRRLPNPPRIVAFSVSDVSFGDEGLRIDQNETRLSRLIEIFSGLAQ